MKNEIKVYKKMVTIKLFQGEELVAEHSIDDLNKIVNSGVKFIKVDGKIINVGDIRMIEPLKTKEQIMDEYRAKHPMN